MILKLRWWTFKLGYGLGPRLASAARKRWVIFRHPGATIRFGRHVYVGPGFSLHIPANGTFIAADLTQFRRGFRAEIMSDGRVVIGEGTIFTYDVLLQCTTSIDVGARCNIGQTAIIVDGNHRFRDPDLPLNDQGYDFEPVTIGDDVTVFSKVTITSSIGRKAVVAANAVVTKPVPEFTLVGGVPARTLESFAPGA